jgi:hypothetical protein
MDDPRFEVITPSEADVEKKASGGAASAKGNEKKRKEREAAEAVERARALRADDPPAEPVKPRAEPPPQHTGQGLETNREDSLAYRLACEAWVRRGGAPGVVVAEAKKLVAELKKNKLI